MNDCRKVAHSCKNENMSNYTTNLTDSQWQRMKKYFKLPEELAAIPKALVFTVSEPPVETDTEPPLPPAKPAFANKLKLDLASKPRL